METIQPENVPQVAPMVEKKKNDYLVPASIIVAGALIALGIYFAPQRVGVSPGQNGAITGNTETTGKQPTNEELLKGATTLGDPNAPVLMVEFADFQCPFCGKFFHETRPSIIDTYVKNGQVLFASHDFSFLGPESHYAAEAARCAGDQGRYWDYHDYLYTYIWDTYYGKGENGENVGAFTKANLKKFAATLKLDTAKFNDCVDRDAYKSTVDESTELGRSFGVSGTPAFFINGKLVTGALPYDQFQKTIEEALKK